MNCHICGRERQLEDFRLDPRFHKGRKSYCKFCEPTMRSIRRYRRLLREDRDQFLDQLARYQKLCSLMIEALQEEEV